MPNFKDFNLLEVPLQESNLIEASAGTGKTYSIAIMVVRLLIEKEIPIEKILMVTFTKAAVAELEDRIRKFVRDAYNYAQQEDISNKEIKQIVSRTQIERPEKDIKSLLKSAIVNLDELSVMTIHGFCQQSLNEFAFETNQLFNAELLQDTSLILEEEIQQFWRTYITTLQPDLLKKIIGNGFSRAGISNIVKGHLLGKKYLFFKKESRYRFEVQKQEDYLTSILKGKNELQEQKTDLLAFISDQSEELLKRCEGVTGSKKGKASLITFLENNDFHGFISFLKQKKATNYIQKYFSDILEKLQEEETAQVAYSKEIENCINELYSFAIQEITAGIQHHKLTKNLISFDDMIGRMEDALKSKRGIALSEKLREKYKAVFIDEFQDTDRQQYGIFDTAFHDLETILFYIGDPKQSIYGWRKADIATYFEAREKVEHLYTMNVNYRSSSALVQSLNLFFQPKEGFDTFYFGEDKDKIIYQPVGSPQNMDNYKLMKGTEAAVPISISHHPNKDKIAEEVGHQVWELLSRSDCLIFDDEYLEGRSIKPSDIGILIRNKKEGAQVKKVLSALNIPAVTVSATQILTSEEAVELIYVLEAIVEPKRATINRALMSVFTRWQTKDIKNLDEEKAVTQFKKYQEEWERRGSYTALKGFISDFEVQQNLLARHTEEGERTITNLYHLLEVLYKTETRQHLNPIELTGWLKRSVHDNKTAEDETEQRIESDEEAVKIVTIHKSKGLEYNIVMAPFLDLTYSNKRDPISYRNAAGDYITANRNQVNQDIIALHQKQSEQENRRLLYVALTRAVFKCFIYKSKAKSSTLSAFTSVLEYDGEKIAESQPVDIDTLSIYRSEKNQKQHYLSLPHYPLKDTNWWKMSYSSLSSHGIATKKESYTDTTEDYEQFIFKDLKKGAKTGDLLHHILEQIPFTASAEREKTIYELIKYSLPGQKQSFKENLLTLFYHVLDTTILVGKEAIVLSDIPPEHRLHEMEFDFSVNTFQPQALETLRAQGISVKPLQSSEGVITGFIDLFFQYNGKYYILDWKSNYLGPELEDYAPEKVAQAMDESNYHLQYLIYTYAIRKYLYSRIGQKFDYERDFGGVIYLYLRGMRKGKDTGVFFVKPTEKQLKKMKDVFNKK